MNDNNHTTTVEPLFVIHSELQHLKGNIALQLCKSIDHIQPACTIGAQKIRSVWHIYINSYASRSIVLNRVCLINGRRVAILNANPYSVKDISDAPPEEKIVFKDIPLNDPQAMNLINAYIDKHSQIIPTSDRQYCYLKNNDYSDTPYKSGEIYMYAQADFHPALPGNTQMGDYNVRVWHKSQDVSCKRCQTKNDHRTGDIYHCPSYRRDDGQIVAFRADYNIMSNFFMCKVTVFGIEFRSSEHAYQWRKCMDCLRPDLARRILRAATPKLAKLIASEICQRELRKWHDINGHIMVMRVVLAAKCLSNDDFGMALIDSEDKIIAESTRDMLWGSGLSPYFTKTSMRFPGANLLGVLLMELRQELRIGGVPDLTLPPPLISCDRSYDLSVPPPAHPTRSPASPELTKVIVLDEETLLPNFVSASASATTESVVDPPVATPHSTHSTSTPNSPAIHDTSSDCSHGSVPLSVSDVQHDSEPNDIVPVTPTKEVPSNQLTTMNTPPKKSIACMKNNKQSPLIGKYIPIRRRIIKPLRRLLYENLQPYPIDDKIDDTDDDSDYSNWEDRASIASEIMVASDFEGAFADNSDY